jgi:ribosomal protein L12E/L44/L45/RPP1/RPP2
MKYVRFRNIKQLEQDKLKELIEMVEENLSGTSAKPNEDLLPPISAPAHHEPISIAQKPKEEEKDVKSNEESNSGSVASVTKY